MMAPRTSQAQQNGVQPWRVLPLTGFLLLLLGLGLLDRGFVSWRNDPRTLPDTSGAYPAAVPPHKAAERRWLMLCGGGMVLLSILLFTREPV